MPDVPQNVYVPVQSAWYSKINWVQLPGFIIGALTFFGVTGIDPATVTELVGIYLMAQSAITAMLKTWFTKTVTPASVA